MTDKRKAEVPHEAEVLGWKATKNDLLEVAYDMAGLLSGECDNEAKATEELLYQVNRIRKSRGLKPFEIQGIATRPE